MSAEDLLAIQDMNDRQMRAEIMQRGLRVPRKKAEKFEVLRNLLEQECEDRLRNAFKDELVDEMQRRSLIKSADGVDGSEAQQCLMSESEANALSLGILFKKYFDSAEWRIEAPEPETKRGSCAVM